MIFCAHAGDIGNTIKERVCVPWIVSLSFLAEAIHSYCEVLYFIQ